MSAQYNARGAGRAGPPGDPGPEAGRRPFDPPLSAQNRAMQDYPLLGFEREQDPQGELMPLAVRMKLDACGWKVSLRVWRSLDLRERRSLTAMPLETDLDQARFRRALLESLARVGERPVELPTARLSATQAWIDSGPEPDRVRALLAGAGVRIDWTLLDRFGRYVLVHLADRDAVELCRSCAEELQERTSPA